MHNTSLLDLVLMTSSFEMKSLHSVELIRNIY